MDSAGINGDGVVITLAFTAKGANGASSAIGLVSAASTTWTVSTSRHRQGGTVTIGSGASTPLPAGLAVVALAGAGLAVFGRRKRG